MVVRAKPESKLASSGAWSWNVVLVDAPLRDGPIMTVQEELVELTEVLRVLSPEEVHLHVAITGSQAAGDYLVQTTLKLPETILYGDESASDLESGVKTAFAALRKAVREAFNDRIAPQTDEASTVTFGGPLGAGEGPQSRRDLVQGLFAEHYERLQRYARRRLKFYEQSGLLSRGEVDPREVVDEAILQALEEPLEDLPRLDYLVWFYELVREQLRRCCSAHRVEERLRREFPGAGEDEPRPDDLQAVVVSALEADDSLDGDRVPDATGRSPEEAAEESDLVALILERARSWSTFDREAFLLHFVEGFGAAEIARLERVDQARVEEALAHTTQRLRSILRDEPYLR